MTVVLALLLTACTSPYDRVDRVCGWRDHVAQWGVYEYGGFPDPRDRDRVLAEIPTYPSLRCLEVMADTMRFDVDALEQVSPALADGRNDLLHGMTHEGSYEPLTVVAGGLRFPFLFDLGVVDELTPSRFVSHTFVEAMQDESTRTGEVELGRLLFSYIRHHSTGMQPRPIQTDASMFYDHNDGVIYIDEENNDMSLGSKPFFSFVHEARHHLGPDHENIRVAGGEYTSQMDLAADGSYAFGLATTTLIYRYVDRTDAQGMLGELDSIKALTRVHAMQSMSHMLPFLDEHLQVLPEYDGFFDGELDHLFWE